MIKKFIYGQEIIDFLEEYGYNKRGEDFEQHKDYSYSNIYVCYS